MLSIALSTCKIELFTGQCSAHENLTAYTVVIYIYRVIFYTRNKTKICCVVIKRWVAVVPTSSVMYRLLQMYNIEKVAQNLDYSKIRVIRNKAFLTAEVLDIG